MESLVVVVSLIAGIAGIIAAVATALGAFSALNERRRRQAEVERWVANRSHLSGEGNREIADRMIQNDLARLIATREFPVVRSIIPAVAIIAAVALVSLLALDQSRIILTPSSDVALMRMVTSEYIVVAISYAAAAGYLSMRVHAVRLLRLESYFRAGGTKASDPRPRSRVFIFWASTAAFLGYFVFIWQCEEVLPAQSPLVIDLFAYAISGSVAAVPLVLVWLEHRSITLARQEVFSPQSQEQTR